MMKLIPISLLALGIFFASCSDDNPAPQTSNANQDFLSTITPHEETVIELTQAEALEAWSNREARLLSVIKPETAIRRWWKAFTIKLEADGEYIYSTIEDDIIPANGTWAFAQPTGTDIILFNIDEDEGEYFERFAEVTFKTTETGATRFELKINVGESTRYSSTLIGEWIYIFQL
ncbi:MAG: hypothetical protein ABJF11_12125 [Reichenbachiella sp.]|uniref:hypothetical protein n=1 Tax=Reichenbachiella sp. TaxID=2184521 RepID=UPI0032647AFA